MMSISNTTYEHCIYMYSVLTVHFTGSINRKQTILYVNYTCIISNNTVILHIMCITFAFAYMLYTLH